MDVQTALLLERSLVLADWIAKTPEVKWKRKDMGCFPCMNGHVYLDYFKAE